ncbi:protein amalgam-like isoform X2 [Gigantopelta aegis]|uniref:protein amalgam-like isoform X2 n=1 Tax=Gigantopelta aegis TaxID=1735272 RepID=UPI001B88B09D|nr:protein amalgam-like isoform X2 [Gigantopelta aegis]
MDLCKATGVCTFLAFSVVCCYGQSFTSDPVSLLVMKGTNVTLFCGVDNLGAASIFWLHNGSVLSLNHMVVGGAALRLSIRKRYNLHIQDVQPADEGSYECQLGTSPPLRQTSHIDVTIPPEVTLSNNTGEIEATLGDDITFHCSATGKPTPNITWSRRDMDLPDGTEYVMSDVITLSDLKYNHGGIYQCTAYNGVGEPDQDGIKLNVYYSPIMHTDKKMVYTGPGVHTAIPCLVSAQPEPLVIWTHNGTQLNLRELPQHKEVKVVENGFKVDYSLVINGVDDSDFGSYMCTVTNSKGTASVGLIVTALPSVVVITSSDKGDYSTAYDIHWNVTAVVVPSMYRLQIRKLNDSYSTKWKVMDIAAKPEEGSDHHSQSYRLVGLIPDTKYEVSMRAANRYGWGEDSDTFIFTTQLHDKNSGFRSSPWQPLLGCSHTFVSKSFVVLTKYYLLISGHYALAIM